MFNLYDKIDGQLEKLSDNAIENFLRAKENSQDRYAILHIKNDDETKEKLRDLHHDLRAAIRSFKYLADKISHQYDPNDKTAQKRIDSINRHLNVIEKLKSDIVDIILPIS